MAVPAVVSWDLAHNPVGRAYVLYKLLERDWDVELVGPIWSRYGTKLWQPLRKAGMTVRSFPCERMADFVPKAEVLAASRPYDLVYVCKPRLPSLYLGALIKESSGCPMVLDVDDFELSFFENREFADLAEVEADAMAALEEPHEELATRYAQSLVAEADAVTVSNVALRDRFGGHIVRHARDEEAFDVDAGKRAAARTRLGIGDDEFALVFVGTPRSHKGVGEVARALHEIGDGRLVFHIVGNLTDPALSERLSQYPDARLVFHPNCAFEELPDILAAADLVPLIQDIEHPISQHQIPAKVSDALSLGVPVLASAAPPLRDLIAQGAITVTDADGLAEAIGTFRDAAFAERKRRAAELGTGGSHPVAGPAQDDEPDTDASSLPVGAMGARRAFLAELGTSVNRARLDHAIAEAARAPTTLNPALGAMLRLFRDTYTRAKSGRSLTEIALATTPPPVADPTDEEAFESRTIRQLSVGTRLRRGVGRHIPSLLGARPQKYDIAFFWKQNDSGIYGRRSDMIARHLVASGRVNRMVHFDAPVSVHSLDQHFNPARQESRGQLDHILTNLFDRHLGLRDEPLTNHRTFVSSPNANRGHFVGRPTPKREQYARYVRQQLEAAGMHPETTYAWFCPVIWDALELIDKVGFAGVVSDLIDDQRAWDTQSSYARHLETNYRVTLQNSDLVFANCDSLADAMSEYAPTIHVVPNGAERFLEREARPKPELLQSLDGPIVGYVGNLRDRIDWLLLQDLVSAMPETNFVLLGPSGDNPNADSLALHLNVCMPGVVRYDEMPDWLRHFDVGIVPHLNNRLTERMNPLKVYNYFAAGLPVVSTEVSNLGALGDVLTVADSSPAFIDAVRRAIGSRPDTTDEAWRATMDSIAWDTRVGEILDRMDRTFQPYRRRTA